MSTIRDVARHAGVSTMTVSRVLNNSGYVSVEARERVEAAIAELGYVPNSLARSLRSKQTRTVALVFTDVTNPFFTTLARGAEDAASHHDFNVILCNTDESEAKQDRYLAVLLQKRVDGILLVPARSRSEPVMLIQRQGVPVVVMDRRVPAAQVDVVRCDSERGAYEMTRYLMDLGHRHIALLTGPEGVSTARDRVLGYLRALSEDGQPIEDAMVVYGDFTQASGYDMAQQVLGLPLPPTALFAANNFIAAGAFRALSDAGLEVPTDVSIVTFDDLPAAWAYEPFMTVVEQPAYDMGYQATELLFARLSGQAPDACQEVILPTRIIVRHSSGSPLVTGGPRDH
jgi:LacI family transcriptional regulator